MSMIQKIEIDGKQVPFKVSAAIPRIYRIKFHRDIYKDLDALGKAVGNGLIKSFIREFEKITREYESSVNPNVSAITIHPDLFSRLNILKNSI